MIRTGPHFEFPPFAPARFFEIIGQHLFTWPLLGDSLAMRLPTALHLASALLVIGFLAWSLRSDPCRRLRATLVTAFLLISAAIVYRSRPDTWNFDNLVFGERYFYIPRLLLFWLLILEFNAGVRSVRWCARTVAVAIAVVHVFPYAVPAPPDYHWAAHCDPIRRGEPADIPTLPEGWTLEYRGRPQRH